MSVFRNHLMKKKNFELVIDTSTELYGTKPLMIGEGSYDNNYFVEKYGVNLIGTTKRTSKKFRGLNRSISILVRNECTSLQIKYMTSGYWISRIIVIEGSAYKKYAFSQNGTYTVNFYDSQSAKILIFYGAVPIEISEYELAYNMELGRYLYSKNLYYDKPYYSIFITNWKNLSGTLNIPQGVSEVRGDSANTKNINGCVVPSSVNSWPQTLAYTLVGTMYYWRVETDYYRNLSASNFNSLKLIEVGETSSKYSIDRIGTLYYNNGETDKRLVHGINTTDAIIIEDGTTLIEAYAFYYQLHNTPSLKLPSTLKTIGAYSFTNTSTRNVDFSECASLNYIGSYAFAYLKSSIGELYLPEGLKTISDNAFNGAKPTKISIPSTVTGISDQRAFYAANPTELWLHWRGDSILSNKTGYNWNISNTIIHVPSGEISNYSSKNWPTANMVDNLT